MRLVHYIEIENFKTFADKQRIELDHPAVIIGPNNCGKTSVIQALALWSQAIKTWLDLRRNSTARDRTGAPLNRLNIVAVPVQRTRCFWHDMKVRSGNQDVSMIITVGVQYQGRVEPIPLKFRNQGEDIVYCTPDESIRENISLIEHAAQINVELLYPLSGLDMDEPILKPNRISVLLGQGRTAEVLRNLCSMVFNSSPDDWSRISELIERLFHVKLGTPQENSRGALELNYEQPGVREKLEISSAGRGFQQMLILLAYLFSHKGCVLLVDEPDAHLEILRQKQIFVLLRDVATENKSQLIIVTHSEAILAEALDNNLILLLEGRAENLAKKAGILESLKIYGAQHYVQAKQSGYVLYVEGGSDINILRTFAKKLNHGALQVWDDCANTYYVQDNYPEASAESELDRVEGGFGITPKDHFNRLRKLLPELRGLAILDNDSRNRTDYQDQNLTISYWQRYEIENYIITPDVLRKYVQLKTPDLNLFAPQMELVDEVLRDLAIEQVFDGSSQDYLTWKNSTPDAAKLIWESKTHHLKLSAFAEAFFQRLSERTGLAILLTKSEYYLLIDLLELGTISKEITKKLDLLEIVFKHAHSIQA